MMNKTVIFIRNHAFICRINLIFIGKPLIIINNFVYKTYF